jgi:hypothetical protein
MSITCAVCGKKFTSIGSIADHISETNKGIQGENIFAGFEERTEDEAMHGKEMEQLSDVMRGFAHVRFHDKNGLLIPEHEVTQLHVMTTAGAKWCIDCRANFANNFRLSEHYLLTGHGGSFRKVAERDMREFQELEKRYF